ncbi:hypothetical protein BH09SUM1_BH09SUM1_30810 [soil metagenome]
MTSFAEITLPEIKADCRFYSGYKPCHKHDGCPGCPHYSPRGEQILIIKLGAMGDVLRTKAILPALKREHPNSWVVWLTDAGSESLARDPMVDEVRPFTLAGIAAVEGRHYARLICLDKDAHAVSLAARIHADRKQGFAPTAYNTISVWNEGAMYALRLGLSDELKYRINEKSMPQIVSEAADLPYNGEEYNLTISTDAQMRAEAKWRAMMPEIAPPRAKHGPEYTGHFLHRNIAGPAPAAPTKIIGLNTGCGPVFATKGWTTENMAALVGMLKERADTRVVLLGGPREAHIHRAVMAAAGDMAGKRIFDAGTDNPLDVFFGLVQKCDLVLSADSLAMHVAIALKRPVIAWFGPTCAQEVDLFGRGEKIVTDFACSPCYLKTCPQDVFCMDAMTPQTVLAAIDRVLGVTA